jgi:hypothetical protein
VAIAVALLLPVASLHLLYYNKTSKTRRLTARGLGFTLIVLWALGFGVALACTGMLV